MALDTSIPLQVPKVEFDPVGSAQKGVTLRKLMTEQEFQRPMLEQELAQRAATVRSTEAGTASTEAATTGQRLLNEQAQRELETKRRLKMLLEKHSKVDPTTGRTVVDHQAASDEAFASAGDYDLNTLYNLSKGSSEAAQQKVKTRTDVLAQAQTYGEQARSMLRKATTDQEVLALAHNLKTETSGLFKAAGLPDESDQVVGRILNIPPTLQSGDTGGLVAHLRTWAPKAAAATISPAQEVSNQQTWEQIAQGGFSGQTGATHRDPNSQVSKAARAAVVAAGYSPTEVQGLSSADIYNNERFRAILANNITPGGVRIAATEQVATIEAQRGTLRSALEATKSVAAAALPTKAGSITATAWEKNVIQNPELGVIQGAVDAYNAAHPGAELSVSKDGLGPVSARLRQWNSELGAKREGAVKVQTSPTVSGATTTPQPQPGQPAPDRTGKVQVTDTQTGRVKWFTPEQAAVIKRDPRYK